MALQLILVQLLQIQVLNQFFQLLHQQEVALEEQLQVHLAEMEAPVGLVVVAVVTVVMQLLQV